MVFDFLFSILATPVMWAINLLPTSGGSDVWDASAVGQVIGLIKYLDGGLPIHETLAALGVYVGVLGVLYGFIVGRALLRFLPSWVSGGG